MKYIRQRYVLFEYISDDNTLFDKDELLRSIWHQVISFFGEHTTFHAGLWMIRFDPIHKIGILRMDNVTRLQVVAAMALVKNVKGRRIIFHTRKTSGTIKKTLTLWKTYFSSVPPPRETEGDF